MQKLVEHVIDEINARQLAGLALAGTLAVGQPSVAGAMNFNPSQYSDVVKQNIDIEKLLNATKSVESSGGKDLRPRHEPGVEKQLRNRFNKLKPHVQDAIKRYGFKRMATSYGPYQVLASTAFDMGFNGDPEGVGEPVTSENLARQLFQTFIHSSKTHTLEDVISAYNAGLGRIGKNPDYVRKVMNYYR